MIPRLPAHPISDILIVMVSGLISPLGIAVCLLAVLPVASAQERMVIPLVPAANWHLVRTEPMGVEAVRQFGGDPTIEREYGVHTVVWRNYHLGDKSAEALLEEAADPTAAYGLMTFYRTEAMRPARGIAVAFTGPWGAAMARGRFYVRVRASSDSTISETELRALLIYIGGTGPSREDAASLPTPLPAAGLVPHSEKYLLGLEAARQILPDFRAGLIGFSHGAEAQVGTYSLGAERATVLALNYPTPVIARVRFGAMENLLGINQDKGPDTIYGRRTGSFVILVLNAPSSDAAKKLIDQFQVTSNVSWNEAAPQREKFILEVVRMILAIILLALIIAAFATTTGVLIFLARRLARRFFPQWEWADTEREQIIRLNLGQQ